MSATALKALANDCRRSAAVLEDLNVERGALSRAALATWQGPAAEEFALRSRRAEASAVTVAADLRWLARRLESEALGAS